MTEYSELDWQKSSLSYANGSCVEMAHLPDGGVALRDSKNPDGAILKFTPSDWADFFDGARHDEFNYLTNRSMYQRTLGKVRRVLALHR